MNQSLLTGLVAGAAIATAGGVFAGYKRMSETGARASSEPMQPIMDTMKTPRQVCQDVSVTHTREAKDQKNDRRYGHRCSRGSACWAIRSVMATGARSPRWRAPRHGGYSNRIQIGCSGRDPNDDRSSAASLRAQRLRTHEKPSRLRRALSLGRCRKLGADGPSPGRAHCRARRSAGAHAGRTDEDLKLTIDAAI